MIRCGGWVLLCCFSLAKASSLITLDVVVTDKSGKPIPGLNQQDFTLLDNKQPQTIGSFDAVTGSAAPVEVVLVVDEVNTAFTNVSYERGQIEKFLRRNGAELDRPTSLVFLSDSGVTIGNLSSRDGNALLAELDQHEVGLRTIQRSQGIYGATERVGLSLQAIEQLAGYEANRPGRKLVIWLSPGWPFLSDPRNELTSKDQQRLFATIVALSGALRQARITLYSIDPLGTADAGEIRTTYYEDFLKGIKKSSQVQVGNLALQVLATQTGGRVLYASNDVTGEIASSVADANAFYVITFDGLPGDGPNEYHSLDIKLDKPGLTARTRSGYYAQP